MLRRLQVVLHLRRVWLHGVIQGVSFLCRLGVDDDQVVLVFVIVMSLVSVAVLVVSVQVELSAHLA